MNIDQYAKFSRHIVQQDQRKTSTSTSGCLEVPILMQPGPQLTDLSCVRTPSSTFACRQAKVQRSMSH